MAMAVTTPTTFGLLGGVALSSVLLLPGAAHAGTPFALEFLTGSTPGTEVLNLSSPGQILSGGSFQYNTINDASGAKLTVDNGDLKDFTFSGTSASSGLGAARVVLGASGSSSPFASVASGRVGAQHSFTGTVAANNPGSLISNSTTLLFNPNLTVTGASFNFSSLNTAGVTWEYSTLQFLDPSGNPFSSLTPQAWTIGGISQYATAGSGFSGQAGIGNWISASTETVIDVDTNQTSSGSNGSGDNLPSFTPQIVGLPANTQIGGIQWVTYLEDVRGTTNGSSNFTSSLLAFSISGSISTSSFPVVDVPGPLPFFGVATAFGYSRRIRSRLRSRGASRSPDLPAH